jgi:hypothetical protein
VRRSLLVRVADPVDQDINLAPHEPLQTLGGDGTLYFNDFL